MDDLLTTKQLQELLQVDRITIYRMLNDGRLHGFKVGGQWRFSRSEIESWILGQQTWREPDAGPAQPSVDLRPTTETLPLSCVEAIQEVCAEALDVAVVTTDLDGAPLGGLSNSCEYCALIVSTHEGRVRCGQAWTQVGAAELHTCHAGLLCVSAAINIHGERVAMVSSCQFVTSPPLSPGQPWEAELARVAETLGLAEIELRAAMDSVRTVSEDRLTRIPRVVRRMASTFSEIGEERLSLVGRLQHISEVSRL